MRVDVMSPMRGVDAFARLWARRATLTLPDGFACDLMSLLDLVQAKKTQRDKDWPMLRRLMEAHYFEHRRKAKAAQLSFWLREMRTPELLIELARRYRAAGKRIAPQRSLLVHALAGNHAELEVALEQEEKEERKKNWLHWLPLKRELERLRHAR